MLFFPPPTRFLNARPRPKGRGEGLDYRSTVAKSEPPQPNSINPETGEEEYVCCFCEHDLLFGSNALMLKAVRRRKKLLERRTKASEKAKGVVDGKGLGKNKSGRKAEGEVDENGEMCPGGDKCRCNEIRAAKKEKQSILKRDTTNGEEEGDGEGDGEEVEVEVEVEEEEEEEEEEEGNFERLARESEDEDKVTRSQSAMADWETTPLPHVETFELDHDQHGRAPSPV